MLRIYIAQQCFGLSEGDIEDAIYDSQAIRGFGWPGFWKGSYPQCVLSRIACIATRQKRLRPRAKSKNC